MQIFVAESSNFEINSNMEFSSADREYIAMYLDMYYSLYQINDIDEIVDINMNLIEELLFDISSLDEYLAGLFDGDLPKTAVIKKAFGEFIGTYVDENYAHLMVSVPFTPYFRR